LPELRRVVHRLDDRFGFMDSFDQLLRRGRSRVPPTVMLTPPLRDVCFDVLADIIAGFRSG